MGGVGTDAELEDIFPKTDCVGPRFPKTETGAGFEEPNGEFPKMDGVPKTLGVDTKFPKAPFCTGGKGDAAGAGVLDVVGMFCENNSVASAPKGRGTVGAATGSAPVAPSTSSCVPSSPSSSPKKLSTSSSSASASSSLASSVSSV